MFGTRLKEILKDKKMSFSDLRKLLSAQEIKVTNSQLSYYANGKRKPKDKNIWLKIAQVLEVDLQEIILDIDYFLLIKDKKTENSIENFSKTENGSLVKELLSLIDENSPAELEKVYRYCSLVSNFENLSKAIEKEGVMILVPSGENEIKKPHPAIAEKVKVNAALIKLDEFFEEKRTSKPKNSGEKDWSKFTK
jgi:Helix-turn-helix.